MKRWEGAEGADWPLGTEGPAIPNILGRDLGSISFFPLKTYDLGHASKASS